MFSVQQHKMSWSPNLQNHIVPKANTDINLCFNGDGVYVLVY